MTNRARRLPAAWLTRAASLVAAVVIWEIVGRVAAPAFLPPFSAVVAALVRLVATGQIVGHLARSLVGLAAGYALATCVGIGAGALMGRFDGVGRLSAPWLNALLAAPSLLFVPVLYTIFGTGRITQVGAVFFAAVFVITATTEAGVRATSPRLLEMAAAFGASPRDLFWRVRWPAARPLVAVGLRVGVLSAVKGMVNGEMFVAIFGLGGLIRTFGARFDPAGVLAVVLVVQAVALACVAVLSRIFRSTEAPT